MADAGTFTAVFLSGLAAGVLGAMVGGGSLLSIPVLIFIGLPPQVAIATDRFAGLGAGVAALYRFAVAGRIVWRWVPVLAGTSLVGASIGASLLVRAPPASLRPVVGALLVLLVPVLLLKPDLGVVPPPATRLRLGVGLSLYGLVQVLAGFFGAGTGTLVFYILMTFFGITITQVAATQTVPFLVLTLSSLVVFAAGDLIDYRLGAVLMAGTFAGGWLGAHIAIRRGDRWIRRVFAAVVTASAIRLLLT